LTTITFTKEGDWRVFDKWNFSAWAERVNHSWGDKVLAALVEEAPFKTGAMKSGLRKTSMISGSEMTLLYEDDVPYFNSVVHGAVAHDIPYAFGMGKKSSDYPPGPSPRGVIAPFGIGGRFDGKFHPGIGNTAYGYPEPNDFPLYVWATMGEAFMSSLAESIKQEFVL